MTQKHRTYISVHSPLGVLTLVAYGSFYPWVVAGTFLIITLLYAVVCAASSFPGWVLTMMGGPSAPFVTLMGGLAQALRLAFLAPIWRSELS
jgi:hypothetical protein